MSTEIIKIAAAQGAGLLALALVVYWLYKLAAKFGTPFIEAQQSQATAMSELSSCMRDMKDTVQGFVGQEDRDHREFKILQQVMLEEIKSVGESVRTQNRQLEEHMKTHDHETNKIARLK